MATKREKQYLYDHGESSSSAQLLDPGTASTIPPTKANSSVISLYSGSLQDTQHAAAATTDPHDPPPQYVSDDPENRGREMPGCGGGATIVTVTKESRKKPCCARCCTCCNCCGIPPVYCRVAWCLIVVGLLLASGTGGILTMKCANQRPVRVDQGKLELAGFKEGELRVASGQFDSGSILIEAGPAGSDVTYRVDVYSSHDSSSPFSQTLASQSNSTWTLVPASVPSTSNWLGHMCERTMTTLTLPSDLTARGNYSLTVVAQNAGIRFAGDSSNGSWWAVSFHSMNGGIKAQSLLKVHSRLSATSTNGGIAIDHLNLTHANASVKAQSTSGSVSIALVGLPAFPHPFTASVGSTNGGTSVFVPRDAGLAWTASSTNGGVSIVGHWSGAKEGELGQGKGDGRQVSMTSVNGGISMEIVS